MASLESCPNWWMRGRRGVVRCVHETTLGDDGPRGADNQGGGERQGRGDAGD